MATSTSKVEMRKFKPLFSIHQSGMKDRYVCMNTTEVMTAHHGVKYRSKENLISTRVLIKFLGFTLYRRMEVIYGLIYHYMLRSTHSMGGKTEYIHNHSTFMYTVRAIEVYLRRGRGEGHAGEDMIRLCYLLWGWSWREVLVRVECAL